ncbi:MAG: response regulator [Nitrospinales bacterium]
MPKEKILVVEDEEDIQELVRYNLSKETFRVTCVGSGEEGLNSARSIVPNLMILDLMLSGVDGLEVCKILKNDPSTANIPIIMLTAKGEEADIVTGLELGADDYVTKPFSPRVLIARVKSVLRRKKEEPVGDQDVITINDLIIHPGRHEISIKGKPIDLTFSEFSILHCLARRPGWVFTRYQIVEAIRGADYSVTDRSVDFQIAGLRKKLGSFARYIETVRGVGYKFKE